MAKEDIPTFGEIDDIHELELDTITVPIISYKITDDGRDPVKNAFQFRGIQPFAALEDFLITVAAQGNRFGYDVALPLIMSSLVSDDERDRFRRVCDEHYVDAQAICDLALWLSSRYMNRPIQPAAGSLSGRARTNGRSAQPAGARGGAS